MEERHLDRTVRLHLEVIRSGQTATEEVSDDPGINSFGPRFDGSRYPDGFSAAERVDNDAWVAPGRVCRRVTPDLGEMGSNRETCFCPRVREGGCGQHFRAWKHLCLNHSAGKRNV